MKKNQLLRSGAAIFLISAIEGIAALIWLLSIPGEAQSRSFLGYSLNRWAMLAALTLAALGCGWLSWKSWRKPSWLDGWKQPRWQALGMGLCALAALASLGVLFILRYTPEGRYLAYYQRLLPLLLWVVVVSAQADVWLTWRLFGFHPENARIERRGWRSWLVVALAFALIGVFSLVTGIGIRADIVDWNGPGIPLLEWQIGLAVFVGTLVFALSLYFTGRSPKAWSSVWVDLALGLAIWCLGVGLWWLQPIPRTYFTPQPRQPNNEVYPYSDAADHDFSSQSELVGNGLGNRTIIKRPLLSTFFTFLHLAAGQDYEKVIDIQTLFLAFFPVGLYFFGKVFHSRSLGLSVALLAILREVNTIQSSPYDQSSHSKMLMSDLPTALGVSFFLLLIWIWFKAMRSETNPRKFWLALISGGALGLILLIRLQTILLAVFLLPLGFLMNPKAWKIWLKGAVLFGLGVFLVIAPWLARNYAVTGRIEFEHSYQTTWSSQRYSLNPNVEPPYLEGESEAEYTQRIRSEAVKFLFTHPGYTAGFLTAHVLNNVYSTWLVLPARSDILDTADAFQITRKFWSGLGDLLGAGLSPIQVIQMVGSLLVIALGIACSWRRWRYLGFIPLAANAAYSLSNAVARNSGWRYMLPLDWVGYFYLVIGMLEIALWLLRLLGADAGRIRILAGSLDASSEEITPPLKERRVWGWGVGLCLAILSVSLTVPLMETVFPKRYPEKTREELVELLLAEKSVQRAGVETADLETLAADPDVVFLWGRALYPVYYPAGEGEAGTKWKAYQPMDERHLAFRFLEDTSVEAQVILRTETSPEYFPNAADVLVAACQDGNLLDAVFVAVLGEDGAIYMRSSPDWRSGCASAELPE